MPIRTSRPLLGLLAGLGLFLVAGCGSESGTSASDSAPPVATATPAPAVASGETPASPVPEPASTSAEATASAGSEAAQGGGEKLPKNPVVELDTSLGKIRIQLDSEKAPLSTKNFLAYVNSGHYSGTIFHRVIPDFMIQGGGFTQDMKEKSTREPIKNEATNGLKNVRGTIAMARTSDPHSATSQFFINVKDNEGLNPGGFSPDGYAVFGKVVSGMDVVDKIRTTETGPSPADDSPSLPKKAVVIKGAKVVK